MLCGLGRGLSSRTAGCNGSRLLVAAALSDPVLLEGPGSLSPSGPLAGSTCV